MAGDTYIQPQPVKQLMPPCRRQSEFSMSALCIEGSRMRSEVWPRSKHGKNQASRHEEQGPQLQMPVCHSL